MWTVPPLFTSRQITGARIIMTALELVSCCVCGAVLLPTSGDGECGHGMAETIQSLTYGGFLVINTGRLIAYISQQPFSSKAEHVYLTTGMALFGVSGATALDAEWSDSSLVAACLSFVTMVVMVADLGLSYLRKLDGEVDGDAEPTCAPLDDDRPPPYAVAIQCHRPFAPY